MQNLLQELTDLLSTDDRLVSEGRLMKNKVVELALNLDSLLLKHLLKSESLKKHFFCEIEGVLIFDKIKFQKFVSNKKFLPDSFTAYKNKIGLVADEEYLSEAKEVVLAWPYKDCVLEGSQDNEDAKRNEVFWNEVLAPDQIDRLLSPKAFTRFKVYGKGGESLSKEIKDEDNLILKGNNLLALHSIKSRYAEKVNLIYIDPPYNTNNDSFRYNDSFSHSTWLTFMKSRLEVARKMLHPSGTIWITIDEIEGHYLKVLCDQIFGRDCFVSAIAWRSADSSNNDAKQFSVDHNTILVYSKKPGWLSYRLERTDEDNGHYSNADNDPKGPWFSGNVSSPNPRENLKYDIIAPNGSKIAPPNNGWRWSKEKVQEFIRTGEIIFPDDTRILKKTYLVNQKGIAPSSIWDDYETTGHNRQAKYELKKLFPESETADLFKTPKPERLLKRVLEIGSQEGDLVMDFFMGAATTCAVAMKMKRRFIGVEQMDYIQDVSIARLLKVIQGEQGGVSKQVEWKGGSGFIYCELARANQAFVEAIEAAATTEELAKIWVDMQENAFLSYRVNSKDVDESKADFANLSLADQKRFLVEIMDKNMLYVPISEIDDQAYAIPETEKALNKKFFD
ncbi:DNA methyltransferase [Undibacterium sp. Ji83W]|uniref:DNA methyltransferase n=1 Tax=Undibacterium sp. Ji83W TaxID=3413043 RepID=UPI003BF031BC